MNWFREHSATFWRLSLSTRFTAYVPFTPSHSEEHLPPPSYRGCWHGVSRGFFLESCHDRALDERALQAALPFFTHAILLDRAFAHCPRFPTAAPRGSPGRVSVPVWLIIRKDQLSIIGLVSLYLTNYLILRRLIKQRFLAFFRIWARTVRQIPTRYAPVRHFVINYSDSSKRRPLGQSRSARPVVLKQGETTLARSLFSFCPAPRKQRSTCMC